MTSTNYTLICLLLASLDAAIAFALILVPPLQQHRLRRPHLIDSRQLAISAAAMGAACLIKLPLLARTAYSGPDPFGLINPAYAEVVLGVPLFCVALLASVIPWRKERPLRRATRPVLTLAILGLLPAPLGVYMSFIEPFRLVVERSAVQLDARRAGSASVRIAVISDIQTSQVTEHERAAMRLLMEQRPDIILLAGDLFQGDHLEFERQLPALRELHAAVDAPGGVFCVLGNLDNIYWIRRAIEGSRVKLLHNEITRVQVRDRQLLIAGLSASHPGPREREVIRQLETAGTPGDIRILLAHRPDVALTLAPDSRVDVVVAGHTHGGQIRLPFIGALARSSVVPRRVAGGGLFEINGRPVCVNRGIGWERGPAPRMRFLCPPTVSILDLTSPRTSADTSSNDNPF